MIAGVLLGLFFGEIIGGIITSVLVLFFGKKATSDPILDEKPAPETAFQRAGRYVFRTLLIAFLVVLLHECYWIANMGAITVNYNTGAYLTQATSREDSREYLRDGLKGRRWQHEIVSARPLKWLLAEEVVALNQANLEFVDFVNGKGIEKQPSGLKDAIMTKLITALWRSDNWAAQAVTNDALNAYGGGLCRMGREELPKYQAKGWILRNLPKEWFQ